MERLIEIKASVERVFSLFGDPVNLPEWASASVEVQVINSRQFRWLAKSINGFRSWEISSQAVDPPAYLLWQATPDARDRPGEKPFTIEAYFLSTKRHGTILRLVYGEIESPGAPPAMTAGEFEQSLENFKHFVERYDEQSQQVTEAFPLAPISTKELNEGQIDRAASPQPDAHSSSDAVTATNPAQQKADDNSTSPRQPLTTGQPLTEIPLKRRSPREALGGRRITSERPLVRRRTLILPLTLLGLAVLVALAAGLLVWLARQQLPEGQRERQQQANREVAPAPDIAEEAGTTVAPSEKDVNSNSSDRVDEPSRAGRPETQSESAEAGKEVSPAGDGDGNEELRQALSGWVAATNARDLDALMSFYAPVAERYYLRENFSLAQVRADKRRLDERATLVDVRADDPEITFSSDRRTARMTFNKDYNVEGSMINKRGRVLAELRWAKSDGGDWKIVSERDLRVDR
jgi:uncharacterized protein YndB with AHSA1/START domain